MDSYAWSQGCPLTGGLTVLNDCMFPVDADATAKGNTGNKFHMVAWLGKYLNVY